MNYHPCKITVLKKEFYQDLVDDYLKEPSKMKICNMVDINQEFLVTNPFAMPEKMCASAWADIRPFIMTMATGGEFEMMKHKDALIAICADPFRPVVFRIERLKEH